MATDTDTIEPLRFENLEQATKVSRIKDLNLNEEKLNEFLWTSSPEPHSVRARLMTLKYGSQITKLIGNDPWALLQITLTNALHLAVTLWVAHSQMSWWKVVLCAYVFGATFAGSLFAGMHEACHGLVLKGRWPSLFALLYCNITWGVPASTLFKKYHLDHHAFLGVEGKDVDLPLKWEAEAFQSPIGRAIWILLYPFVYTCRPWIVNPKPLDIDDFLCATMCAVYVSGMYLLGGIKTIAYILMSCLFSFSIHPLAGHFLSEHIVTEGDGERDLYQETNNFGTSLENFALYNLGLHIEHHDFMQIPARHLPKLRKIAPEFFVSVFTMGSICSLPFRFIFSPKLSPYSRVKRLHKSGAVLPQPLESSKRHEKDVPLSPEGGFVANLKELREAIQKKDKAKVVSPGSVSTSASSIEAMKTDSYPKRLQADSQRLN